MSRPTPPRLQSSGISTSTPTPRVEVGRTKEPAHLPLHRRLLFPTLPIEKPLPPIIFSGTTKRGDIDLLNDRIYNLIALTLRAYVLSWYPRFSKDRSLLPILSSRIIVPILSPILTGIYEDPDRLIQLLLLDLPSILTIHLSTYWKSRESLILTPHLFTSSYTSYPESRDPSIVLGEIYHHHLPLLSVTPSPGHIPDSDGPYRLSIPKGQYMLSPLYLTTLSDAILRLYLPSEEYGCNVERSIAREIVGRVVLGGIGMKLGYGWFWWNLILRFTGIPKSTTTSVKMDHVRKWSFESIVDKVFGLVLGVYSGLMILWTMGVSVFAVYTASPPIDEKYRGCALPWLSLGRELLGVNGRKGISARKWGLRFSWGVIEAIITLFEPVIDRIAPHLVRSYLTPATSLRAVDLLERILYPNDGYPGVSPPDLTPEEAKITRDQLEIRLKQIIPASIQSMLLPFENDLSQMLDPLDDPGCNAHLIAMILDSIVAALEPELVSPLPSTPSDNITLQINHIQVVHRP